MYNGMQTHVEFAFHYNGITKINVHFVIILWMLNIIIIIIIIFLIFVTIDFWVNAFFLQKFNTRLGGTSSRSPFRPQGCKWQHFRGGNTFRGSRTASHVPNSRSRDTEIPTSFIFGTVWEIPSQLSGIDAISAGTWSDSRNNADRI